jgi:hypothetical protein
MKTTVVPAQITSVEDRIAGNLSFKQLLLLVAPVFLSTALFIFLPPFTQYRLYKVIISLIIASICLVLAIRVRSRLVVDWIGTLSRYNLRPRYYIFNKNSVVSRKITPLNKTTKQIVDKKTPERIPLAQLVFSTGDVMNFENTLSNPQTDFHFLRSKKGGLRVHIKEVK